MIVYQFELLKVQTSFHLGGRIAGVLINLGEETKP